MKRILLIALSLTLIIGLAYAKPMQPGPQKKALEAEIMPRAAESVRSGAPAYTFTTEPMVVGVNYYDYMIGSYNGIPIHIKRDVDGNIDGYFMTYHGLANNAAETARRVYYAAIDASGFVTDQGYVTQTAKQEGYPAMAIDPVGHKPFYAWHANADDDPVFLEVEVTSDSYFAGMIGYFNESSIAIDNPWTTIDPNPDGIGDTDDNEFIWPQMAIGPSPVDGMRRVYVSGRNASNHTPWDGDVAPSENALIAFADFDTEGVEYGHPLEWNYTSIPWHDAWHHAGDGTWRRPSNSFLADDVGNIYYVGHHFGYHDDDDQTAIDEPQIDLFICSNYGEGEWQYVSGRAERSTWNPDNGQGEGYFQGDDGSYQDHELIWDVANSSHFNAVRLNNGNFMFPAVMAVTSIYGGYYPSFQYPKSIVIDPSDGEVVVKDIYPRKHEDDDYNTLFTPWDVEAPWGEPEHVEIQGDWYLDPEVVYPFPHYDQGLHEDAMMFHYNHMKVTNPNEDGLMVAVWQDCYRAKAYNENAWEDYADFQNTPEVWISVSSNGYDWTDPIILNNVETPEFHNLIPMWVYPANEVITVSDNGDGTKSGKIAFMFYHDNTWGSHVNQPPAHAQADGGNVMFMEMIIDFPGDSVEDGTAPSVANLLNQNYPNPFNPETNISFDMPRTGNAKIEVFNVKGQLVKTLFNDVAAHGRNNVVWSGDDNGGNKVSSGVYFYRLNTEFGSQTRKMMLMK